MKPDPKDLIVDKIEKNMVGCSCLQVIGYPISQEVRQILESKGYVSIDSLEDGFRATKRQMLAN